VLGDGRFLFRYRLEVGVAHFLKRKVDLGKISAKMPLNVPNLLRREGIRGGEPRRGCEAIRTREQDVKKSREE